MDHKLHTAVGLQDIFTTDYIYRKEIEVRVQNVFEKYAYTPISSPTLEFAEVFGGKVGKAFKIIDNDGSVLNLRTDMTPPIARIVSTTYSKGAIPLRLCYTENSFRQNENLQGKSREFKQAGVELIGVNSIEADCEIIKLAITSLVNTGLKDFKITLGHVDFINGILEENAFDAETLTQIQALIIKKDFISIKNFTNNKLLCNLQFCVGDISVIDDTIANITNSKSKKSLMLLRGIYDKLKSLGYGGYISYDLSMIGNFEYYTGIIFSAYAYGIGFSIIDGGRYDNLLSYFGLDLPAVGFAVKINDLSDALKYQNVSFETASAVTLAAYDDEAWLDAIKVADELRAQGLVIENSLIGPGLKENLAYATSKNIEGVLYFEQGGTVKIIDLIENSEKSANIADLLNGGGPI